MKSIHTTLHPSHYQGHTASAPYFEGWYFKLISADRQHRYAVIPGISLSHELDEPHSFIQVLDGSSGETVYHRYPLSAFSASQDTFAVQIGTNIFTESSITMDLPDGTIPLQGKLDFEGVTPWPVTLIQPGIMGWYAWVPRMECYHGVVSLDHALSGTLKRGNEVLDFNAGRGYIEKDWGQAFPSAWIWMQSNHFSKPGISLTASVAMIPWMRHAFRGMIIGLLHEQRLYRFATYTGARTDKLSVDGNKVHWVVRDRRYELTIHADSGHYGDLRGPSRSDMGRRVPETLQANIQVLLTDVQTKQVIYSGQGACGGLELGGNIQELMRVSG